MTMRMDTDTRDTMFQVLEKVRTALDEFLESFLDVMRALSEMLLCRFFLDRKSVV